MNDLAQHRLLRDQHRRAAAMLPQTVPRVDQRGKAAGHTVFAQRHLNVPASPQMTSAVQQQAEYAETEEQARPAGAGEGDKARSGRIAAEDAQRALEDAQRSPAAQQKISGGRVDEDAQQP